LALYRAEAFWRTQVKWRTLTHPIRHAVTDQMLPMTVPSVRICW
jgi:hypothetical protein